MAALATMDSPQVTHLTAEAPACHHSSVPMLIVHEWHPFLVLLEEVVPEEVLEVDLVVVTLTNTHPVEIVTERNTRRLP